jgi:hypothetical protein
VKINWKKTTANIAELFFYSFILNLSWFILASFNLVDPPGSFNFLTMVIIWLIVFFLGDYLIAKHDAYLFKRKIMKIARQVARLEGIDPKDLDYDDIKINVDEEGYMDIEINVENKRKQGEKK